MFGPGAYLPGFFVMPILHRLSIYKNVFFTDSVREYLVLTKTYPLVDYAAAVLTTLHEQSLQPPLIFNFTATPPSYTLASFSSCRKVMHKHRFPTLYPPMSLIVTREPKHWLIDLNV